MAEEGEIEQEHEPIFPLTSEFSRKELTVLFTRELDGEDMIRGLEAHGNQMEDEWVEMKMVMKGPELNEMEVLEVFGEAWVRKGRARE